MSTLKSLNHFSDRHVLERVLYHKPDELLSVECLDADTAKAVLGYSVVNLQSC